MSRLRGIQLAAVACLVLAAAPRPPEPTPDLTPQTAPRSIATTASEVDRFAAARFPDLFTGVAVDDSQTIVIVYRIPSEAFDTRIRQRFPRVRFVLANASMSAAALSALSARIADDMSYWRSHGVQMNRVGPDPARSAVGIGVGSGLRSARRQLEARYGADHIYVEHAEPAIALELHRR